MAYDTVANIVSDAAAELGLGTISDVYGSLDANVVQLRTLLKSLGKDLVKARDWTHLVKEYSFVTRPNWTASTVYTAAAANWLAASSYQIGDYVNNDTNGGSGLYVCTQAGSSAQSFDSLGPVGIGTSITDTSSADPTHPVVWKYLNAGHANIVVHGSMYYTCSTGGTSGLYGPNRLNVGGTESDNTVTWTVGGPASDYALPSDFSNMIDQSGWNRTNRLPVGGPIDGQTWQYLKGRQQGVVFNVLFRPVAGVLRLYPDTDTPGGYAITFEYISNSWVSATGGTTPTTNAPTANSDILYFDRNLLLSGLKLRWLKAKGFSTAHAQPEFDEALERAKNIDGSAPVLNLRGRGPYDPLIGVQNVPITGFGS